MKPTELDEREMQVLERALGRALPRIPVSGEVLTPRTLDGVVSLEAIQTNGALDKLANVEKFVGRFIEVYFSHFDRNHEEFLSEFAEKNPAKYIDGLVGIAKAVATKPSQTLINVGNQFTLADHLKRIKVEEF